jgi:hypothetical protein
MEVMVSTLSGELSQPHSDKFGKFLHFALPYTVRVFVFSDHMHLLSVVMFQQQSS